MTPISQEPKHAEAEAEAVSARPNGATALTLTPEQRQAVAEAGDAPVTLGDPQSVTTYVLVRADVFEKMRWLLDEAQDQCEKEAWGKLARKARNEWAEENPY